MSGEHQDTKVRTQAVVEESPSMKAPKRSSPVDGPSHELERHLHRPRVEARREHLLYEKQHVIEMHHVVDVAYWALHPSVLIQDTRQLVILPLHDLLELLHRADLAMTIGSNARVALFDVIAAKLFGQFARLRVIPQPLHALLRVVDEEPFELWYSW